MIPDDKKPSFTVRVAHSGELRDASPPELFWQPFRMALSEGGAGPPPEGRNAPHFEAALLRNFNRVLTRRAKEFRAERLPQSVAKEPVEETAAFSFRPHDLSYGSLFFPVEIAGLLGLIKFLFGDPELVLAFLHTCVPDAFLESIGADQANLPLQFTVTPSEALEAALAAGQVAATPGGKGTWADVLVKAQRVFWLLPTLLALAVLFVGFSAIVGERDRLQGRETALNTRDLQLQTAYETRLGKLEAVTVDLIKQLRVPAEKPVAETCCVVCCPPPKCPAPPPAPPHHAPPCKR